MSTNWIDAARTIALFVTYIGTSCIGLYLIKSSPTWKSAGCLAGLFLYGGGAALWLVILRLLPLSFAFPIAAGGLVMGTMFTGMVFLKEVITIWQSIGAAMIVIGILLIAGTR